MGTNINIFFSDFISFFHSVSAGKVWVEYPDLCRNAIDAYMGVVFANAVRVEKDQ